MRSVVVVTGAAQGMGQAHCLELARHGYHVCAADVLPVEQTVAKVVEAGGVVSGHVLDVSSETSWKAFLNEGLEKFGRPYGLVNNAGILSRMSIHQESSAGWDKVMAINLRGPFLGMQAMAPVFRSSGGGSIINIASSAALAGYRGAAYTAAKWGLRGLTKTAAGEFAPWGVRVNAIHPGLIETPLAQGDETFTMSHLRSIPMGRPGQGTDISKAVAFLMSEASTYITGADLSVDGGFMAAGLYGRIVTDRELFAKAAADPDT